MELGKGEKTVSDNKKKNIFTGIKASFSGRKLRSGAYVTAISLVVVVIVLVVNMLFSKINLQVDLSSQNMFTLSKDSKDLAKEIKDDVTIYYLVQSGSEDNTITNIVKQYETASKKIKLEYKDPVLYPTFAKNEYGIEDEISNGSFIVVNNSSKKAKYVDNKDLFVTEFNQQTYQEQVTGSDVEGEITSAIQSVTTTKTSKMYIVEGHGETESGTSFAELVKKMNVTTEPLKTSTVKSIPKDCDILLINAPTSDFTDEETKMVKDFLIGGGKAIVTLNFSAETLKNFQTILEYYGVEMVKGVVFEGDTNMHQSQYPHYLFPDIKSDNITNAAISKKVPVIMPIASGLVTSDQKRGTVTITPLLTTSESSYSKVDTSSSTAEKEKNDINGPFNVALVSTDSFNGVTSGMVVFGSPYVFADGMETYANSSLLSGSIGYCIGNKNLLSIPTKSYASASISPTGSDVIIVGSTVIIIIPIIILVLGGVICYRRRRR